jgi:NADPH-dependent 2,4-dienoyl-CoA reductase/sulfur reductase-like enzyme/rhodanese-related sulfurtransferase
MAEPLKVVVIGGVAAGPKVAARIMRLQPNAQVTLLEKTDILSFAGCGLPYYVMDLVKERSDLMTTPAGAIRDAAFFEKVKGFKVLTRTEAIAIDTQAQRVTAKKLDSGEELTLEYDKLVLATGARPVMPPLPGRDLKNVHTMHTIPDADAVRSLLKTGGAKDVVVVGGGLIGLEMTEALVERGCKVTIIEMLSHVLPILDWEMAQLVEQHLEAKGVRVMTKTKVQGFLGGDQLQEVATDHGPVKADLALLSVGVRPNVSLAQEAGIAIGPTGAIRTDEHMRTSDPNVYAVGDCAETTHLITQEPAFIPLGSTANKQGRVVASHICGLDDIFPGVLGSTVCKVFDFCVARTGLTEDAAKKAGYNVITALVPGSDRPHYMPTAKTLMLKLVVDVPRRRLLGAQAVGPGDGDKRIDVAATAITGGISIDLLDKLDLCYAPPFSPAMDNLVTAVDVIRNKLDRIGRGISPSEVHAMLGNGQAFTFLDVRSPQEVAEVRLPQAIHIPLGALRARLDEIPRDKPVVAFCKASLRGYEAARILMGAGYDDVRFLDGGVAMWPFEKEK